MKDSRMSANRTPGFSSMFILSRGLQPGMRIRITFMQIRIHLFTNVDSFRVRLFSLLRIQIRIQLLTLMRIHANPDRWPCLAYSCEHTLGTSHIHRNQISLFRCTGWSGMTTSIHKIHHAQLNKRKKIFLQILGNLEGMRCSATDEERFTIN